MYIYLSVVFLFVFVYYHTLQSPSSAGADSGISCPPFLFEVSSRLLSHYDGGGEAEQRETEGEEDDDEEDDEWIFFCLQDAEQKDYINVKGCVPQFEKWLQDNLTLVAGIFIGVALLQVGTAPQTQGSSVIGGDLGCVLGVVCVFVGGA